MPTFTIMGSGIGYIGGNYKNEQPGQAAKKAGKALFNKLKLRKYAKYKNKTTIKFVLRMRDRNSAGKTYAYMVTREKLSKPLVVKRGNVEYTINYNYKIESCNLSSNEVKEMTGGALEVVGGTINRRKMLRGGSEEDVEEFEEVEDDEEDDEPKDDNNPDPDPDSEMKVGGRSKSGSKSGSKSRSKSGSKSGTKKNK
jgi:hypothetical protein